MAPTGEVDFYGRKLSAGSTLRRDVAGAELRNSRSKSFWGHRHVTVTDHVARLEGASSPPQTAVAFALAEDLRGVDSAEYSQHSIPGV